MAFYRKTPTETWSGRIDGNEQDLLRWHQIIQICEPENLPTLSNGMQGICIMGFCSDEGVRRNKGRTGAAAAPEVIRKCCSNFPMIAEHIIMADAGDVVCADGQLEAAQNLMAEKLKLVRNAGYLPIVLGGGHETAYCSYLALGQIPKKGELGIINFDAHFDLRSIDPAIGHTSGTWVWQITEDCKQKKIPLHYLVMGIQQYGNTKRLFEYAEELGAPYFLAEEFTNDQLHHMLNAINGVLANSNSIQLSVDMDVFASPFAPGVSAPAFNGIAPNAMFKRLLRHIILSGKVSTVDISEVNPMFDVDNRTARLASAFVFDIVQAADINAEYPG
ncbi:MAG: formimidoylglutamase [Chitinophagaceae bacterium]|jgi:formiminoglutamase|nr:formimidoylglutamase [Chitinophagaceae bacterium]MCU0403571.1 formimidoylglutamase [Chitinophagaceae bacterium]